MSLSAVWREVSDELAGDPWRSRIDQLHQAVSDPAIWSRDDRHRVFSDLELADRIGEAARTAERLFERYDKMARANARTSRELAGRLALQLYNVRLGIDDFAADAPIDALLRVEPAMDLGEGPDAAAWCGRLTRMYRRWAEKRRMRIKEIPSVDGDGAPVLLVTGFGAFRTLKPECGLHIFEEGQGRDAARRTVARVSVHGGPELDPSASGAFAVATRLLAPASGTPAIVRRYREEPAPLVRDLANGWRSGRLAAVLEGDFDLIGAIGSKQAA